MKLKEVLKFEKENMPDFQWKFEKFLFAYLLVWLGGAILTLIVSLVIGFVVGEDSIFPYIPLIVWGSASLGMTVALAIKSKKVKAQLLRYHLEDLSRKFYQIEDSEAKRQLLDEKKITEEGFIVSAGDIFETEILPFDQAKIIFNPRFWGGKLFLEMILKDESNWRSIEHLGNGYYNFFMRRTDLLENRRSFELFVQDKEKFVKMLLRYNDASKIEKKLQTIK